MAEVEFTIAGRPYRVACRTGEEANLRAAAALVDEKSREALAGLGTLSEARQFFFAALLLADTIVEQRRRGDGPDAAAPNAPAAAPAPVASAAPPAPVEDPVAVRRAAILADRLEFLADSLEPPADDAYMDA